VDVAGDRMLVDLTGSSEQAEGPVNCGWAQAISACRVAFKLVIHPERPVDGGTFRTLDITIPEGTIFNAQEPAACQWYFTPLGLLIDLVVKALAPALPDKAAGAHYGDSMVIYISGKDPRRGGAAFLTNEPTPGGWGAFETGDGQDGLINNVNGAFKDYPVEIFESKYPILMRGYGFRPDTGGPGRFRGGCGVYREYQVEAPARVSLWFERSVTPAWGLFGGATATGPDNVINPGTPEEQHLLKVNALPLKPGDVVRVQTGGGGGFDDPLERDHRLVQRDVLDGYVSRAAAERDYGVVLRPDLSIDEDATRGRRSAPVPVGS
jgi:N-methylhydantoinase B